MKNVWYGILCHLKFIAIVHELFEPLRILNTMVVMILEILKEAQSPNFLRKMP